MSSTNQFHFHAQFGSLTFNSITPLFHTLDGISPTQIKIIRISIFQGDPPIGISKFEYYIQHSPFATNPCLDLLLDFTPI